MNEDRHARTGVGVRPFTAPPRLKPRLRPDVIRRKRLIDHLSAAPFRIALISAPAGFGKTTVVLDWLQASRCEHVWLALSEFDNEPHRFFGQLASGLGSIDPSYAERLHDALEVNAPMGTLATRLLEDLAAIHDELVLVMDDYQHIETPELHRFVGQLPELLPPGVRLVLATRVDPPFSLAKLRLTNELVEIRERDLRFSHEEVRVFFAHALGAELETPDLEALEARTEGWIAGLQMAAISLRSESDVATFVRTFTGSNAYVVDYLLEEVIQRQSPEVQQFLLRTSILSRFDARLCRAVTGMDETERLLLEVETANLFLVSLDRERSWFRYHHLFAELLATRLRRLHSDEWDVLHERASVWCEAEGDVVGALQYARLMTTNQRRLLLLERYGYGMLDRSEVGAFVHWSAGITDAEAADYPRFLLVRGWIHLLTERIADVDALLARAERAVERSNRPYSDDERMSFRGMIDILRAYALRLQGRCEESIDVAVRALAGPAARDVRNCGLLYFNLGRGQACLGRTDAARASFQRAYDYTLQSRTWYLVLGSAAYSASLMLQREGLVAGLDHVRSALSFAADQRLDEVPACGYLYHQLGSILLLQNELNAAEEAFVVARERGAAGRVHDVHRNAVVGLVRVYAARGDFSAALDALREFGVAGHAANPLQLDTNYDIERARIALLRGELDQLDAWCETQACLTSQQFSTLTETTGLLLVSARLALGQRDCAAAEIAWLDEQAGQHGRGLTRMELQIARATLLYDREPDAAVAHLDDVLRRAASERLVLPFHSYGEPVRRVLERVLVAGRSPAAAAHARHILRGSRPRPNEPRPMFRQPLAEPLTEREQEVLFHLSRQLSYQAIADLLFVTHDTVKTHVKHIYAKLGASSRREAVARGSQAGLVLSDSVSAD